METPERNADFSFEPVALIVTPRRVLRNHNQNRKRTIRIQTELDRPSLLLLPKVIQPAGREPPSVGRIRRAAPERIDQVASVTRNGCRRRSEMSRPLVMPT